MELEHLPYKTLVDLFIIIHRSNITGLTPDDYTKWMERFESCPESLCEKTIKLESPMRDLDIELWREIRERRISRKPMHTFNDLLACGICGNHIYNHESMNNLCRRCKDIRKCDVCNEWVDRYGVLHDGKDVVICDKHPLANINWCENCEKYVERKVENIPMYDERHDVCESCKEDLDWCDNCEQWFDQEIDGYVYCENSGNTYCESCVGDGVTYFCAGCGLDYDDDEYVYVENENRTFCKECFEDYFYTCESCDEPVHRDDAKMVITSDSDGDPYCESCADNMDAFYCEKAENLIDPEMCPFESYILETIDEICEVLKITEGTPTEKLKKILEKVKGE